MTTTIKTLLVSHQIQLLFSLLLLGIAVTLLITLFPYSPFWWLTLFAASFGGFLLLGGHPLSTTPPVLFTKTALFLLTLLYASGADLHQRLVPPAAQLLILGAGALYNPHLTRSLLWFGGALLLFLLLAALNLLPLPGGDMKFLAVCCFFFGDSRGLIGFFLGLIAVVVHLLLLRLFTKKNLPKTVPLIPYLSIGYTLCLFL